MINFFKKNPFYKIIIIILIILIIFGIIKYKVDIKDQNNYFKKFNDIETKLINLEKLNKKQYTTIESEIIDIKNLNDKSYKDFRKELKKNGINIKKIKNYVELDIVKKSEGQGNIVPLLKKNGINFLDNKDKLNRFWKFNKTKGFNFEGEVDLLNKKIKITNIDSTNLKLIPQYDKNFIFRDKAKLTLIQGELSENSKIEDLKIKTFTVKERKDVIEIFLGGGYNIFTKRFDAGIYIGKSVFSVRK